MIKELLKRILEYLNYTSVSLFAKIHFRKAAKSIIKDLEYIDNDKNYLKKSKKFFQSYEQEISVVFHKMYTSLNGIKDVRYIPDDLFFDKIERYYNKMEFVSAYTDKGMYKRMFPNVTQPKTIALNMNGIYYDENYKIIFIKDVLDKCEKYKEIVIKPTIDTGGGKDVTFITSENQMEIRKKLKDKMNKLKKDYIIQEGLLQHKDLKQITPESINTIRTVSFFHNDKVIILNSVFRMGINGSRVDNGTLGGIYCKINNDGSLGEKAFDVKGKVYNIHPQGFAFSKGRIPNYDAIKSVIITEHEKLPYFKIISWDFSVNEEGHPVMIELNLQWQGIDINQVCHGPLFGDLTDEVLSEVFLKKKNKVKKNDKNISY